MKKGNTLQWDWGNTAVMNGLREDVAVAMHRAWSNQLDRLLNAGQQQDDGSIVLSSDLVNHWTILADSSYFYLPEREKTPFRGFAGNVLLAVEGFFKPSVVAVFDVDPDELARIEAEENAIYKKHDSA